MSRFSRLEVAAKMVQTGLVPLFYHPDESVALQVLTACYEGGARVLEFTNRGDSAYEVFRKLRHLSRSQMPDLALGIGSVIDPGTASLYMQAGADFIVMPSLREDVALACNRRKLFWSAGCFTPTEIGRAEELGCEIVKIFPGDSLGPAFIKAVKGPSPWTSLMPTGGVDPSTENLRAWFDAGASCVGMGSQLITRHIIDHHQYEALRISVSQILDTIKLVTAAQRVRDH